MGISGELQARIVIQFVSEGNKLTGFDLYRFRGRDS
jgi:hypothetical protein